MDTGEISQPPFLLNTRNRTLEKNGQRVKLTQVEYSIVKLFMDNPGKALSREEILDSVWGRDYFGELKIVDVNIRRLRIKIEDDPTNPTFITTVWGYGYKWGFCRGEGASSMGAGRAARARRKRPEAKAAGAITPGQREKRGRKAARGMTIHNPAYITTVWGYGYKWGF